MRLPIRARIALSGALVVCGTVALFGLALVAIVRVSALRTVDDDLLADRSSTTFLALAGPDVRLRDPMIRRLLRGPAWQATGPLWNNCA